MMIITVTFGILVIIESLMMMVQNEEINGLKEENQYLRGALREYKKKEADVWKEFSIIPEIDGEVVPLDHK